MRVPRRVSFREGVIHQGVGLASRRRRAQESGVEDVGTSDAAPPEAPFPRSVRIAILMALLILSLHTVMVTQGLQGGQNLVGPNLHGVFGRRIGTKPDYDYSEAAEKAGFVWDGGRLDGWLADPRGFLPGTKMAFPGIKTEPDRRDVIAYLMVETGYRPAATPPT